jgi:hypothetical protein
MSSLQTAAAFAAPLRPPRETYARQNYKTSTK